MGFEVAMRPDPAVFLVGPSQGEDPEHWARGARAAIASDFGLTKSRADRKYGKYLDRLLGIVVARSSMCDCLMLRFRNRGDLPIPVAIDVVEIPEDQADAWLESVRGLPEEVDRAGAISVEPVEGTGWVRVIYYEEFEDTSLLGTIRYYQRFPAAAAGAYIRASSIDPLMVADVAEDLDGFVRTFTIFPETGGPV
jgi:hypothetical protein